MVQSLGISIGNANSYVAAGQGGGIEILLNEYSTRSTPSMVAFTDHSRSIGIDASSNFFMNLKNTIYDLIVLLGKPYEAIDKNYPFKLEETEGGQVLVVVRHLGEERKFTITQILAMLFTKLRGVAYGATDCVLSCPQFYTEVQKDALVQAATIAGLNPLQLISDMSAVVLNYAYYRTTKDETHKFIAFINFGQSNLQAVIAWLTPRDDIIRILAAESETIGGRDFDKLLADYFVQQYSLNLTQKSYLKLLSACERLKKNLSSNTNKIPIHVESLISDEKDFTADIDRATFEELSGALLQRVEACLKRTLENAKVNYDVMVAALVEPAADVSEAATPMDSNEQVETAEQVEMTESAEVADQVEMADVAEAPKSSATPETAAPTESTKSNDTANQSESAKLANQAEPAKPAQSAKPDKRAEPVKPPHFELQTVELVGGSTRIPAVKNLAQKVFGIGVSTTLNTDEAVVRGCVLHCATLHPGMKVKREVQILGSELFYKPGRTTCDKELRRMELELITSDIKYKSRTEARNNLEEYIYAERGKLQEGDQFLDALSQTLEWLFTDEGDDAQEEEYNTKLNELKKASEARLVENNNKQ